MKRFTNQELIFQWSMLHVMVSWNWFTRIVCMCENVCITWKKYCTAMLFDLRINYHSFFNCSEFRGSNTTQWSPISIRINVEIFEDVSPNQFYCVVKVSFRVARVVRAFHSLSKRKTQDNTEDVLKSHSAGKTFGQNTVVAHVTCLQNASCLWRCANAC